MEKSFLTGTLILTLSSIVVKIIGSLNWIILSRVLGGEGIGLYQMGFPIYLLGLSISSAGFPVAISIITAEKIAKNDYLGARKVFTSSLYFLFGTGLFFTVLLIMGANSLITEGWIRDQRAQYSIFALAPAIFFVTFLSSFRGYLQGWQTMKPTAVSEVVEQLLRVVTMIVFASLLLPYGIEYAAAGASLGAAFGAIGGLITLIYFYRKINKDIQEKINNQKAHFQGERFRTIIVRLLKLSLPVSMSSLMLPVVANLDLLIVPQRLEIAGYSVAQATELFGYLTGMAVPLVNLSTILTASLAISLVPSISSSRFSGDTQAVQSKTNLALKVASIITIPCSIGLYVLANPLATFIYNAPAATEAIQMMSMAIFLLGLHQVSTGILQGLSHTTIPVLTMILAAVFKVLLNWQLTALPLMGIKGAALATVADIGIAAILNLLFLYKYVNFQIPIMSIVKIFFASIVMGSAVHYLVLLGQNSWSAWIMLPAMIIAVPIYLGALLAVGALEKEVLAQIPFVGNKIISIAQKFKFFN